MHRLHQTGLLALLALVLAGCGSSVNGPTHASTNASFAPGAYIGTTSQALPISFTATPATVQSIEFNWQATCADGQSHTNTIVLGDAPINSGAFSTAATLNTGASSAVSGRLVGNTASGGLSRTGPSAFGTDCTATGVTWRAHRSG